MVDVLTYAQALEVGQAARFHVILGNGFSIAVKPDIFTYGSLFDNADFSDIPEVEALFGALETNDFEIVIRHLIDTATVLDVYDPELAALAAKLRADADKLKDVLVEAVASRHPDRPYDLTADEYAACRHFLSRFNHIYTVNYDVLLYWALMQTEVDELALRPDDGFRHPEGREDEPFVSWQQSQSATVHYLHGALHLFDAGTEIIKYTWSKTDIPIVDQIRAALDEDKYPLFVAEGDTDSKMRRIVHNAYLHKALRSLEASAAPRTASFVVFGHSLDPNDAHIFAMIARGGTPNLLVSLHGDPESETNQKIVANCEALAAERAQMRPDRPLRIVYFDAGSANVWG